jgi:uncharacterized protein (DUF952 family)
MGDLARWGLCGIPSGARHNRHRLGEPLRERCVDLDLKLTTSQPGITAFMIFHVVAFDDWLAVPDRSYAPASLAEEGFTHCSPDEPITLAVASAFYRDTPGMLMVLLIDEHKLDAIVRWEAASPVPPPGVAPSTLFPHVYGRINRDAVQGMMEVQRDADGRAVGLAVWS